MLQVGVLKGRAVVGLLISAWWLGLVLLFAPGVRAAEGIVIHDDPDANGYRVTVLGRPNPISVGKVNLLIRLARPNGANGEAPLRGAKVVVEFNHISGPGADNKASYVQRRNLVADESEPGTYEVSDSLQNEGVYRISLNIDDNGKKTVTSFDINAQPQPDDRFLSVMLLALFPIFLAWLVWMYLKRPSTPRKGDAQPPSVSAEDAPAQEEVRR